MKVHQTEALTLKTYPYAESHKIAVFLTRDFGKLRGVAYGAKKTRSPFGTSLEPLTHLRLTFGRKEHRELSVVRSCEIMRAFPAYQLSWEVNLHFSYFTELLMEFAKEEEASEKLFRLSLAVLKASRQVPIQLLARYLEFWLLQLEGILPPLGGRLPMELAVRTGAWLKRLPNEWKAIHFTDGEVKRLERFSGELIEDHLEKKLKARKILKELL